MAYCSNCGQKLSEKCNFCPQCGQSIKQEQTIHEIPEETIPSKTAAHSQHKIDHTYTLLDKSDIFNKVYRIEKILGKENDGISYLAIDERTGSLCSVKLFFQSYFDNVDKLFGAIVRMAKIKAVNHPNVAKVYEVNQSHKPAFIASEYIEGNSLQEIKDKTPELFTEDYVRDIAKQLISAAIAIRKAGLAVRNLNLQNIIQNNDGRIVILSTGINYDVGDEAEDIFYMGIVLAKLFSRSAFYETIYIPIRLIEKKFDYLSGITLGVNDILAQCLHRNISQRFASFEDLSRAFDKLIPVNQDEIITISEDNTVSFKEQNEITLPIVKLDIYFWSIIIFIIIFICIVTMTNLLDTIFSNKKATFKFTGFITEQTDSTNDLSMLSNASAGSLTHKPSQYRNVKVTPHSQQKTSSQYVNPDVKIPAAKTAFSTTTEERDNNQMQSQNQTQQTQIIQKNFVYLYGDTFTFGSLRKDARDNASLNGFFIANMEVTQAEWNKYMKPVTSSSTGENLPVDNVSWYDIVNYCNIRSEAEGLTPCYKIMGSGGSRFVSCNFKANGYRLPTEAEWEYAAKGKFLYLYSGGDNPDRVAWYKDNADAHIHPVKTKSANGFGLYDMTGNVAEWCWDWYDSAYPKTMPFINPSGPDTGNLKVIRGGSIESPKGSNLEVIYRNKGIPARAYKYVGFRLVRGK